MALKDLVGNSQVAERLCSAIENGRLPHALLFVGPAGVGKRAFAGELARAAVCLAPIAGDACESCSGCIRSRNGEHLDIRVVEPDGAFIKIAQIRDLAREAIYHPYEAARRVFIVDEAHRLREEAANALLKTLEEPPSTTVIILVTDQPYALPETIRSRCQSIGFASIEAEEIERFLSSTQVRPQAEIRLLSRIASGRIGKALSTDLSVYKEKRKEMLGLIEVLAGDRDRVRLMKAAQYMVDVSRKDKTEFDSRIEIFLDLCRDVYGLTLGESPDEIANPDVTERLEEIARCVTPSQVAAWVSEIDVLRQNLRRNVSRQIALEAIFMRLSA
jgi:DNA polymerase-3 subunit delta'